MGLLSLRKPSRDRLCRQEVERCAVAAIVPPERDSMYMAALQTHNNQLNIKARSCASSCAGCTDRLLEPIFISFLGRLLS